MNNKFNIGDKVWFKLDSYGRKAEMYGTIRDAIYIPGNDIRYSIETVTHKYWNISEKDINYSAPHTREHNKVSYNYNREDEKYYTVGMPVRYSWGGPGPDNIRTGMIVENSDFRRGFYVIKDDRNGEKYNISANRILGYNTTDTLAKDRKEYIKHDEESCKDFLNKVYGNPDFKPEVHSDAADSLAYSIKRKLDRIHSSAVYGLDTDLTMFDEFVNKEDNKMKKEQQKKRNRNIIKTEKYQRTIKDIKFNGPAVIIEFEPSGEDLAWCRFKGDKVVVVCKDGDKYDMKTGFLLAILKEFLNNQSYGNILEKLDSFDAFDIPQVGKDIPQVGKIKFDIGDIVRFKNGTVRFRVDDIVGSKVVPRYRITRIYGSGYSTYANENVLVLADDHKEDWL